MLDQNEVQGRELIRLGKCSQPVIQYAYQAVKSFPHLDLCEYLVNQGQLSPIDAEFVRASVSGVSPAPQPAARNAPPTVADFPSTPAVNGIPPQSSSQSSSSQGTALKSLRRLGDYEILEEIAQGGMGAVYLVQSVSLKTKFALKTLLAGQLAGSEALERFMLEAETTARLNHPNIVRIHHIGVDQGFHYLVMDYIEGPTLKELVLEGDWLSEKKCAALIAKLANALSYAHRHAILHRDVKPANVLIRQPDGEPLLTDFGLAKDVSEGPEGREGLTLSGQAVGTPEYMSPEQADGDLEQVDRRSDVYSLGATLYQLLTKKPPFQGTTVTNTLKAVMLNEPDSPKKYRPKLSTDLETICLKCLEKEPAQRYSTAQALAEDLQRFLADEAILARPPSISERFRRWRRRHSTTLQLIATVLLTSSLILGFLAFRQYRLETRREEIQSVQEFALKEATRFVSQMPKKLAGQWHERLLKIDKALQDKNAMESIDEHEKGLTALAEELKESRLRAKAGLLFEEKWRSLTAGLGKDRGSLPRLNEDAIQSFVSSRFWIELEAHRQYSLAHYYDKKNEKKKAEFARTRAYQVSPSSQYGNQALLDAAELILQEERFVVADQLFSRIIKQSSPYLRGRAYYGRARVALWRQKTSQTLTYIKAIEKLRTKDKRLAAEMTPRKLQWLKEIASRFSTVKGTAALNGTMLIPSLPGQAPLFRKLVDEQTLQFYMGDWKNKKIELKKGPVLKLPGDFVIQRHCSWKGRVIWGIQYIDAGNSQVAFYEWDGSSIVRLNWSVVSVPPKFRLELIGDIDNNGDLDIIIHCPFEAKSSTRTQTRVILNVFTPSAQEMFLREAVGSVLYCVTLADLDGDGRQEIVLGLGEWSHFCVLVYKLNPEGNGYLKPFRKLLGVVLSADVRRDELRQRDEVILTTFRRHYFDVKTIFKPSLRQDLPSGIWRLTMNDKGEYQVQKSAVLPFELRNVARLSSAVFLRSLTPHFPGSHVFLEAHFHRPNTFHFVPGADSEDLPRLLAKAPRNANRHYRFSIHDLDGDGEGELVFGTKIYGHYFYGLKDEVEVVDDFDTSLTQLNNSKIEEDPIEVALNLLDLEQGASARAVLEQFIGSKNISRTQWVDAHKYLAMSWVQEGNYKMAKRVCLDAWRAVPRQSFDLVLEAAEYACKLGDYQEAMSIIDSIPDFIQLNPTQKQRVKRDKIRIAALVEVKEIARVDAAVLKSESLPFSIRRPWFFRWTDKGFSMRVQRLGKPFLSLPIVNKESPIQIHTKLRIPYLHFGEQASLGVTIEGAWESALLFHFFQRGGGDLNSIGRTIRWVAQLSDSFSGTSLKLKSFNWFQDIELNGFYDAEDNSLRGVSKVGEHSTEQVQTPWRRLNSGLGQFYIGYKGKKALLLGASPGHTYIEFQYVSFNGDPAKLSLRRRDSRDVLGEAGYQFFLGHYEKAESLVLKRMEMGQLQRSSALGVEGLFLIGLARCRRGDFAGARKVFEEAQKSNPKDFFEVWGTALCVLSNEEIGALSEGVFHKKSAAELRQLYTSGIWDQQPAMKLLAVFQTPERESLRMGWLYFQVGAYERSTDLAKTFFDKSAGQGRYLAGHAAYFSGHYQECLDYWQPLMDSPNFLQSKRGSLQVFYDRAKYVLEQASKSPFATGD